MAAIFYAYKKYKKILSKSGKIPKRTPQLSSLIKTWVDLIVSF